MSRANLVFATACLLCVLSVGCSDSKVAASDAQIATDIQSKLYADPATRQSGVAVTVKDGAVTLSGDVPSTDVELAAMKIANSSNGVRGVADQMKVSVAAAPSAAPEASAPTAGKALSTPSTALQSAKKSYSAPAPVSSAPSELPPTAASSTPYPASSAPSSPASSTPGPYSAAPSEPVPAPRPAERPKMTIAAGERLSVRTVDAIDSSKVAEGQALRASLESPLVSQGQVVVPAGAPVTLEVANVRAAGRINGKSELVLRATSLEYRGRNYRISSSEYADTGKSRGKNTALKTGIGAGIGALIGGLAGGGKGAAIGAGAGGGAGFGYNALTHGNQIKIPSETVLNFRLEDSLTVPAPRQ